MESVPFLKDNIKLDPDSCSKYPDDLRSLLEFYQGSNHDLVCLFVVCLFGGGGGICHPEFLFSLWLFLQLRVSMFK